MAEHQQQDLTLNQLQSRAQVELLDAIDKLRADQDGLQMDLRLPKLVVCGDTSSGKSSVLEAISGVRFPAADLLCTRFASELVLRRADTFKFAVSIRPAGHRNADEKKYLSEFRPGEDFTDVQDFPRLVNAATAHMRELDNDCNFFEDTLVARVSGPNIPPLTLVDLPGLIHASPGHKQGDEDIRTVKKVVESYMAQESSIILAVVAADNNSANQIVLQLLQNVTQGRSRTLGIITKPDRLYTSSPSEQLWIRYAQNREFPLDLGWHVLRNRDPDCSEFSAEDRDTVEAQFFRSTSWNVLPENNRGAATLRTKLSGTLLRSIQKSLPQLVNDIKSRITACEHLALKLGEPKLNESEQRKQLTSISQRLCGLIEAAIRGDYMHSKPFFYESSEYNGSVRRMRARLRAHLNTFAEHMRNKGQRFSLVSDESPNLATVQTLDFLSSSAAFDFSHGTELITFQNLKRSVVDLIKESRGTEPERMFSPIVVGSMFSYQSSQWESIAGESAQACWKIAEEFFHQALYYVAPPHIAETVLQSIGEPYLDRIQEDLMKKLRELLKPYKSRHFSTLTTDNMAAKKEDEMRSLLESGLVVTKDAQALQALDIVDMQYGVSKPL